MQLFVALSALLAGGSIIDLDLTAIVQAVIFFAAFLVLYALVFRPAMALFDARDEAIEGSKEEAKKLVTDAQGQQKDYEEKLKSARNSANAQRESLRGEGQSFERDLLDKVRGETQELVSSSRAKLDAEARESRESVVKEAESLGRDVAVRILGREING